MKKSILNLVEILFVKANLRNMLVLIATGMVISLNSCESSSQNTETQEVNAENATESKTEATIFENQEVGWTIELSNEWSKKEMPEQDNSTGAKNLLLLHKGKDNMLIASANNIGVVDDKAFEENHFKNLESIFSSFKKRGFTLDTIDGHHFIVYNCSLSDTSGTHVMKLYFAYINGFDFMTMLMCNNDIDKASLIKMMNTSKFKTIN
jgi:hypothetical protein